MECGPPTHPSPNYRCIWFDSAHSTRRYAYGKYTTSWQECRAKGGVAIIDWAGIVGALAGSVFTDFQTYGLVIGGGVIGLVAGLGLRRGVRIEVEQATRALQDQIDSPIARGPAEIGRSVAPTSTARAGDEETGQAGTRSSWATPPSPAIDAAPHRDRRLQHRQPPLPRTGVVKAAATAAVTAAKNWLFGGNTIVRVG